MNSPALSPWAARGRVRLAAAVIAIAALAAYAGSFGGPFVLDDAGTILSNPTIRHLLSALSPPRNGIPVSGRPVANFSFALNYAVSGSRVWSYHVLNLSIHVLAALALFGIARRTLERRSGRADPVAAPTALAFAIALLWAVHPLQTEAVTYLSQRVESLMGMFYLLTVYGFIRSADGESPGASATSEIAIPQGGGTRQRFGFWSLLSVAACLLGMATKEVMVTAPVVVLLYDRVFVAGSFRDAWRARRGYYLALAGTWLVLLYLVLATGSRGGTAGYGAGVPWWAYAFTQFRAVAHYLRLCLWPHPLVVDYGRILGGPPFEMIGDIILVAGLVAWSAVRLAKGSPWGFLGAWYFLILAPSSSVVPVATEIIAEHRAYLSLAAVVAAVVGGAYCAGKRIGPKLGLGPRAVGIAGWVAVIATASILGVSTAIRNEAYGSVLSLWADAVAKTPESAGARNNFGNALAEKGLLNEAIVQYREALRLVPNYDDPHYNLGNALVKEGQFAEAIENYRAALRFQPHSAAIRYALGNALRKSGRVSEAGGAYEQALEGESDSPEVWYNLGNAFLDAGQLAEAEKAFGAAVRLRPGYVDALVNHAGVLAQLGRGPDAVLEFEAAVRLEPDAADVHNTLGGLLAEGGRLAEARAEFEQALRLKPDYREARDNLERVRRMEGKGPPP